MKKGQTVTVDKFLTTDPYGKRGESGKIMKIEDDIIHVRFNDGIIGKYLKTAIR